MVDSYDTELFGEEEIQAINTPPKDDEPEPAPVEPAEKVEPSPPVEAKVEPPESKVEPEPVPPVEKPVEKPTIDGIIAKDGKNFIPFSVLEDERTKRQQLEARIVELEKPKPVEPKVEPPPPPEPPKPPFDLEAAIKDVAHKTYASEEEAVEGLKQLVQIIKQEVTQDVQKTATATATEVATTAATEVEYGKRVTAIKVQNPWIQGDTERFLVAKTIDATQRALTEGKVRPNDIDGLVAIAAGVVEEGKKLFRVDEPKVDLKAEVEKATKAAYEKGVKDMMVKFNIIDEEPKTLSDVRNVNPDTFSKFDEIDKLSGIDYEEAVAQLTPTERDAFLRYREA